MKKSILLIGLSILLVGCTEQEDKIAEVTSPPVQEKVVNELTIEAEPEELQEVAIEEVEGEVLEEWLYYDRNTSLYKVKRDGTAGTKVADLQGYEAWQVSGNTVAFIDAGMKLHVLVGEVDEVMAENIYSFRLLEDKQTLKQYLSYDVEGQIFLKEIGSQDKAIALPIGPEQLHIYGGQLYYKLVDQGQYEKLGSWDIFTDMTSTETLSSIYTADLEGSNQKQLLDPMDILNQMKWDEQHLKGFLDVQLREIKNGEIIFNVVMDDGDWSMSAVTAYSPLFSMGIEGSNVKYLGGIYKESYPEVLEDYMTLNCNYREYVLGNILSLKNTDVFIEGGLVFDQEGDWLYYHDSIGAIKKVNLVTGEIIDVVDSRVMDVYTPVYRFQDKIQYVEIEDGYYKEAFYEDDETRDAAFKAYIYNEKDGSLVEKKISEVNLSNRIKDMGEYICFMKEDGLYSMDSKGIERKIVSLSEGEYLSSIQSIMLRGE